MPHRIETASSRALHSREPFCSRVISFMHVGTSSTRSYEPDITGGFEDGCLKAMCRPRQVGYLWFVLQDDGSILLSDIQVFDKVIPPSWLFRCWIPRRWPPTASYRNRGIGNAVMTRFLQLADEAGVQRIYGSLTAGDLATSPFLESWYLSFGFAYQPVDSECLPNSKYKIERISGVDRNAPSSPKQQPI